MAKFLKSITTKVSISVASSTKKRETRLLWTVKNSCGFSSLQNQILRVWIGVLLCEKKHTNFMQRAEKEFYEIQAFSSFPLKKSMHFFCVFFERREEDKSHNSKCAWQGGPSLSAILLNIPRVLFVLGSIFQLPHLSPTPRLINPEHRSTPRAILLGSVM